MARTLKQDVHVWTSKGREVLAAGTQESELNDEQRGLLGNHVWEGDGDGDLQGGDRSTPPLIPDDVPDDGPSLSDFKKDDLIALAQSEDVELAEGDTKAQIVEKIEAKRAG
jgi:hypothetical protein